MKKGGITTMDCPRILINVAATIDGKIDTITRKGASISSMADKRRVDEFRASVDAVLVDGKTLLAEDPKLTVSSSDLHAERLRKGLSKNPAKVGVVSKFLPSRHKRSGKEPSSIKTQVNLLGS